MSNIQLKDWNKIISLLESGVGLIPIWDEDRDGKNGKKYRRKAACFEWTRYQSEIISKEELWLQLETANTSAVAIVCGSISGNLEVIDIDIKYKPGVEVELISAIRDIYPEIYEKLRIHGTPSGGLHLLYRILDTVPDGNKKLARRPATEEELKKAPKTKAYAFIETRGEGGYVAAPPMLGYSVKKNTPIQELTKQERDSLINLCIGFNEYFTQEKPYEPSKQESEYYDKNPFEDYNNRINPVELFASHGFTFVRQTGKWIWFTRPGGKTGDVHASFNIEKRYYYIFSTNTVLESDRAYLPATVTRLLQFNGDGKATHAHLVSSGYGKIKSSVEKRLIKKHAMSGQPLPANASQEAQTEYIAERAMIDERFPHGVFWTQKENGTFLIDREKLYVVAESLGFRSWQNEVVRISSHVVDRVTERVVYDTLKAYIQEEDYDTYCAICNSYEAFLQKSGVFSLSRLKPLEEALILLDTRSVCYKFFKNGFLTITASTLDFKPYEALPSGSLIWGSSIQARDYRADAPSQCLYTRFLAKAIANDEEHLQSVLGFLTHQYKDETLGYIIVLTEEVPDPKEGGGTGKNIFAAMLSYSTTLYSTPGVLVKYDEKFLQAWNYERVFSISDVLKNFSYEFLKEFTTGVGKKKNVFKDEVSVPVHLMPKFIVSTQFSYEVSDGGLRRRIIPLEFTDFFTKKGGVDVFFKAHFPRDWTSNDWAGYDAYIATCIQTWLRGGLKLSQPSLSQTGRQKQFDMSYGPMLRQFIEEHIDEWVEKNRIEIEKFRQQYDKFCSDNDIQKQFHVSPQRMNSALAEYCEDRGIIFENQHQWSESGIKFKGKYFGKPAPF